MGIYIGFSPRRGYPSEINSNKLFVFTKRIIGQSPLLRIKDAAFDSPASCYLERIVGIVWHMRERLANRRMPVHAIVRAFGLKKTNPLHRLEK